MASLVADYGSDEDSNSNSEEETPRSEVQSENGARTSESTTEGKNLLISQDDGSESEEEKKTQDSSLKGDQSKTLEKLPNPMAGKLPKPAIGKKKANKTISVEGSVFVNPFEKAEQAKQSILEKHVKMTENQHVTGKKVKICWKFRKGRCPFGKNCKYSHDVDSNLTLPYQSNESEETSHDQNAESSGHQTRKFQNAPPPQRSIGFMGTIGTLNTGPQQVQTTSTKSYSQYRQQLADKEEEAEDDNYMLSVKKKKRYGIAQNLIPSKKAMSALTKQRTEERPWTIQNKNPKNS